MEQLSFASFESASKPAKFTTRTSWTSTTASPALALDKSTARGLIGEPGSGLTLSDINRNRSVYDHDNVLSNSEIPELLDKLIEPGYIQRNTKPAYYGLITDIIERKMMVEFDPGDEVIDRVYEQI